MELKALIITDDSDSARLWGLVINQIGIDSIITDISVDFAPLIEKETPDIVMIMDFNEKSEEIDICAKLRREVVTPILYMTYKTNENFMNDAYAAGADDVIAFPIGPKLFQAKVKAWLRRVGSLPMAALDELNVGEFIFIPISRVVMTPEKKQVRLTHLEARLFYLLISHPGRLLESEQIVARVWGSYGGGDSTLLKSLVYRLRQKIEPVPYRPVYLLSEEKLGYKFEP